MSSKALFQALNEVDDRYLDLVDAQEKEINKMGKFQKRPARRKSITFLIAAAICVSILATTALATGIIPGIFRAMKEQVPEDEALYEAAAQANTNATAEVKEVDNPQLDLTQITLFERYYDGETILLGYDLSAIMPEPLVGYVPENGNWSTIKVMEDFSTLCWERPQDWENDPVPENSIKENFPEGGKRMDTMFHSILSPEAYEKAWQILREDGQVCVRTHNVYIGDHIYVNDADIGEVLSAEVGNMRWDYQTEQGLCTKITPLPKAGRNQEEVTVSLKIKSLEWYWYLDMEGNTYMHTDNPQSNPVEFTLKNVNK